MGPQVEEGGKAVSQSDASRFRNALRRIGNDDWPFGMSPQEYAEEVLDGPKEGYERRHFKPR